MQYKGSPKNWQKTIYHPRFLKKPEKTLTHPPPTKTVLVFTQASAAFCSASLAFSALGWCSEIVLHNFHQEAGTKILPPHQTSPKYLPTPTFKGGECLLAVCCAACIDPSRMTAMRFGYLSASRQTVLNRLKYRPLLKINQSSLNLKSAVLPKVGNFD